MTVTADVLRRAETDEKWQIHSDQKFPTFSVKKQKEDLAELACFAAKNSFQSCRSLYRSRYC